MKGWGDILNEAELRSRIHLAAESFFLCVNLGTRLVYRAKLLLDFYK